MLLHVITACSRPQLLHHVSTSIVDAATDGVDLEWHVLFDLERRHVGGQALKNTALDEISDGWVCFLDDDTVMHPLLIETLAVHKLSDAIVVSQERNDGRVLHARRENLRVGHVDIGQAVIRRDVIGDHRIPDTYVGDGIFLENVLVPVNNVVFIDEILSSHNAITLAA